MADWVEYLFSLCVGSIVGWCYFRGLWWTVLRIRSSFNPVTVYLVSLAVRTSVLLGCLYLLLQLGVVQMLVGLVGYFLTRVAVVRYLGLPDNCLSQDKAV